MWQPCCDLQNKIKKYFFWIFLQVAPTSSKQHGVNVGVNASAAPFQQASGYGSHGYSTGNAFSYALTAFKMQ